MAPACWSAIWVEVIILAACYELQYPKNYTSLSEDLKIEIINISWPNDFATENNTEFVETNLAVATPHPSVHKSLDSVVVELLTDPTSSEPRAFTKIRVNPKGFIPTTTLVAHFPCNLLWHGGRYWLRYNAGTTLVPLDVRWYNATLILDPNTPSVIETFQETVDVQIKFYNLACTASTSMDNNAPSISSQLQLQLVFCGHSEEGCRPGTNRAQLLHSEEIWPGFEPLKVRLSCELFGQAGRYLIWLLGVSTTVQNGNYLLAESRPLHAEWSKQFVFNVHARSIFPCETLPSAPIAGGGSRIEQGITVLFEYPECILPDADRVRVFARKESTLSSVDPASLIYVAEQRVLKGRHSATFPCALFSENYLEYCFVYVSGARSGAASDVRVDCVPTLPVGEFEAGAWGTWSSWTQCSTSCGGGGIRNRYRFCDSPPPRYGAKFCEGKSLQSERCPEQDMCPNGGWSESGPGAALPADSEVVQAEVGPGCRCGCVVHLGTPKPRRLLATSSQSCPGRTFWLIQAEDERHVIELNIEHFRLACESQWLKVRDGDSLAATLVAHITEDTPPASTVPVHVRSSGSHLLIEFFSGPEPGSSGVTNAAAIAASECRGGFLAHAQQIVSDSKNGTAILIGDGLKLDDGDKTAITLTAVHLAALSFVALVLLLSAALGVQYTLRYRKYQRAAAAEPLSPSHSLHGSTCSTNPGSIARFTSSTTLSEIISLRRFGASRRLGPKHERLKEEASRVEERTTVALSTARVASLATEDDEEDFDEGEVSSSGGGGGCSSAEEQVPSPADSGQEAPVNSEVDEGPPNENSSSVETENSCYISPESQRKSYLTLKHSKPKPSPTSIRRALNFSPQRNEKKRRGRHKNSQKNRLRQKGGAVSPVTEEDNERRSAIATQAAEAAQTVPKLSPSSLQKQKQQSNLQDQEVEKTPPHAKASKEKQNRARCLQLQQTKKGVGSALLRGNHPSHQRVLQAGSSEFSLTGTESEMELDYYDYNVHNASAVPGSYLGMDPAYLIWIPPSSPSPDYTDNVSLNAIPEPSSGKSSPNSSKKGNSEKNTPPTQLLTTNQEGKTAFLGYIDPCSPLEEPGEELVALTDLPGGRTAVRVGVEKETRVEKCSSLIVSPEEDIKFADDDEEEIDNAECALVKTDDTASKKSNSSLLDSISGKHIRV